MRITEVTVELKQLEEGWKQKLAAVALSAGAALGGGYSGGADAQSFANFPWSVVDSQFRKETSERFLKNVTVEDVKKLAFLIGLIEPYYERNDLNRNDEKDYRQAKSLLRQSAEKLMSETQQDSLRKIQKQGFEKTIQGVKDKGWDIKIPGVIELGDLISSVSNKSSTGTNKTQSQLTYDKEDYLKKHIDRTQDRLAELKTYDLNLQHNRDYADNLLDLELRVQQIFLGEYKSISNPLKKKKYSDLLTIYNSKVDELASYVKNGNTASAAQQTSNSTKSFSEAPTTDTPEKLAFALGVVSGNWEFLSANDRNVAKRVYEQWKKIASPAILKKFEQGSEEGRQSWSTQEQVNEYTKAVAAYYAKQAATDKAQEPQSTSREPHQPLPTDANTNPNINNFTSTQASNERVKTDLALKELFKNASIKPDFENIETTDTILIKNDWKLINCEFNQESGRSCYLKNNQVIEIEWAPAGRMGGTIGDIKIYPSQSKTSQSQFQSQSPQSQSPSQASLNIIWNHNNSKMKIDMVNNIINIYYSQPRQAMLDAGAKPNDLLVNGAIQSNQITGTARIFAGRCGQFTYPVTGNISNNGREISLNGQAPVVNLSNCQVTRYVLDPLSFNFIETNSQSQSQARPSQSQPQFQPSPPQANSQPQNQQLSSTTQTLNYSHGKYVGEVINGKAHGYGTYTSAKSGTVYTGQFIADTFSGDGTMIWTNGSKFVGSWINDLGINGVMTLPNGFTVKGSVKNAVFTPDSSGTSQSSDADAKKAAGAAAKKAAADKALKDTFRADALAQSSRQNSSTDNYATKIRNCIRAGVSFPTGNNQPNVNALFRVFLNPDGSISDINLVNSSGNSKFDNAVKVGIQSCSKFPKLANNNYPKFIDVNYNLY